jgi:hypothetical protein
MQSTGHTSTQLESFVPMHGSLITYATKLLSRLSHYDRKPPRGARPRLRRSLSRSSGLWPGRHPSTGDRHLETPSGSDVSYNTALISSVLIYESFDPTSPPSWVPIGGTSAAAPQWSAIDAIANQADGQLGFLTPRLYQIYDNSSAYSLAFHDITTGNNSWGGVTGYSAGPGWDAATGIGTPDVDQLVMALASTTAGTTP